MIENNNVLFQRLLNIISHYGYNSVNEFALKGLEYSSSEKINRLKKGGKPSFDILRDISNKFDDLNIKWLISGKGEMLNSNIPVLSDEKCGSPYYNQIVSAGNQLSLDNSDIKGYINIPEVKCMAYFDVRGYSMKGVVENGDIIGVDKIEFRRVDPAKPHLIITTDQYMVKYIHYNDDNPEYITCTSTNHEDFKVYIEDIVAVYLIKVITRFP